LREFTHQVELIQFDPSEPIDYVFTEINELEKIAQLANNPFSEKQKIDKAYIILQSGKNSILD